MHKLYLYLFFFTGIVIAVNFGKPLFDVKVGDPRYEYKSVRGVNSYVIADRKKRVVLKKDYYEYYNLNSYKTKQRFFRVHIPITLTPNLGDLPESVNIIYSFSFDSIYKIKEENKTVMHKKEIRFPYKWEQIPLTLAGKTEWTLTSEWMVQSDKDIWDNGDFIVETDSGVIKIVSQPPIKARSVQPLVTLYFPFTISYRSQQNGFNGKWQETVFPKFIYRKVEGNEVYSGCKFQILSARDDVSPCGSLDAKELKRLFENLKTEWKNPYTNSFVFTNLWEAKSWARQLKKIAAPKLKAAFLSRICITNPDDSDAADLLLSQLVALNEIEKASRVYAKCTKRWPQWSEHWFKNYMPVINNELTRRALLMSHLRAHPKSGFALKELTFSLLKSERLRAAEKLAKKWRAIEPSNIFVYASFAQIAEKNDNEDDAARAYSQAIRYAIPPQTNRCAIGAGYAYYLKGNNFLKAGKTDTALRFFRKYLTFTNSASAHLKTGDAYKNAGLKTSAVKSYKQTLQLSPNHPGALAGLIRSYKKSNTIKFYQKKLEKVLVPLIQKQIKKNNLTNALELAKFLLDVYPNSLQTKEIYIRALIHLELYEQASAELYKIHGNKRFAICENALWAELLTAMHKDKSVLLLCKEKIDLAASALQAWKRVASLSSENSVAYLEQALLYLEKENYEQAYLALKKCYKKHRLPQLAEWIANICLHIAEKSKYRTLPNDASKTFGAEAVSFFKLANANAVSGFFSPSTAAGLFRAAKIESKSGADFNAYLRKGLRAFPSSPELRALQINLFADAGATAPKLWAPYTNTFENLRPQNHYILSCLEKIYKLREVPENIIIKRKCLNNIFYAKNFYKNINGNLELFGNRKVFTIERKSGFRLLLKKHIFIQPPDAYEFFALRSKYTAGDLKNGKTLYWKKHLLCAEAHKIIKDAFSVEESKTGEVAVCYAAVRRDLARRYMLEENDPATVYSYSLIRDYFLPIKSRPKLRSQKYYSSPANTLKNYNINVPSVDQLITGFEIPPNSCGASAYPPSLRKYFYYQSVTDKILPDMLKEYLPSNGDAPKYTYIKTDKFSLPRNNDFKIITEEKNAKQKNSSCILNDKGLVIHQAPGSRTGKWSGVILTPLISKNEVPVFNNFFKKNLKLEISGASVSSANIVDCNRPFLSIVLTPALPKKTSEFYDDECLTFQFSWKNLTNAFLKIYSKTYSAENGFMFGNAGVLLCERKIITPADLKIKISKSKINLEARVSDSTNAPAARISVEHKLSEFAWQNGAFLSIQTKACEHPVDYKISNADFL